MLSLFDPEPERAVERATDVLNRFPPLFGQHMLDGMRAKLGLFTQEDGDVTLADDLLAGMQRQGADFTNTFRALTSGRLLNGSSTVDSDLASWHRRWEARRERQPQPAAEAQALMRRHNPAVIPRNHNVEAALAAANTSQDYSATHRLRDVLATPYDHERDAPAFSVPGSSQLPYRTFCGT
jgi:uncharacterized protein YdiU (UPF0061 family)